MIRRFCDNCGSQIAKPIEANGSTVRTSIRGHSHTRHFCFGCMDTAYLSLVKRD